eukprot:5310665-Alexandrium_andersonii.AAC.1
MAPPKGRRSPDQPASAGVAASGRRPRASGPCGRTGSRRSLRWRTSRLPRRRGRCSPRVRAIGPGR